MVNDVFSVLLFYLDVISLYWFWLLRVILVFCIWRVVCFGCCFITLSAGVSVVSFFWCCYVVPYLVLVLCVYYFYYYVIMWLLYLFSWLLCCLLVGLLCF